MSILIYSSSAQGLYSHSMKNSLSLPSSFKKLTISDMDSAEKKDVPGLYALKVLCALFVVMIHVPVIGKETLSPIIRIAVPCFYLISGFFLYADNEQKEIKRAWKWIKKTLLITILINLFYFLAWYRFSFSVGHVKGIIKAVVTGESIAYHLWYLTAMWQALIIFVIIRRYLPACLIYFAPTLILLNLLLGRYIILFYHGDYTLAQYVRLNCFSVALPCICLGYLLKKYICILSEFKYWWIMLFVFIVCIYGEELMLRIYFINNNVSYSLFTLPIATCIFLAFYQGVKAAPSWILQIGKKHSANIYYFHVFISVYLAAIFRKIFNIDISSIQALLVFLACIVFSFILRALYAKLLSVIALKMGKLSS